MLYSLDIETKCAVKDCVDKSCKHALIPHLSEITCIGVWNPTVQKVFRGSDGSLTCWSFFEWTLEQAEQPTYVLHNGKFDYKHIKHHGYNINKDSWVHDTQLMAFTSLNKVPQEYLDWYSEERKKQNKDLPRGFSHRDAGPLSLKTLAPYFLGVKPFWEDPTNHDSDEYVLKDCEYTYRLYEHFQKEFSQDPELKEFYEKRLMPWNKMLLEAELRGITIDRDTLAKKKAEAEEKLKEVKGKLDLVWADAHLDYRLMEKCVLREQYDAMAKIAFEKAKDQSDETLLKITQRYQKLLDNAVDKLPKELNLDSPKQLLWLFKDYLGLDVTNFSDEESTGKEVLQKLAQEGREDIKLFLEYRKNQKLLKAFFPTYAELMDKDGALHTSFNITGTKTGRLSSSLPNLQQVSGELHELFVARPGYKLITRDASYIEPRLIAYYTEDPVLCDLILRDGDFHSANAIIMCGLDCEEHEVKEKYPRERKLAKTVGLALLYGAGPNRIHQTATQQGFDWTYPQCKEIFKRFKEEYEHTFHWKEEFDKAASQRPIKNLLGFKRRYLPDEVYMQGFNGLIQGSASMLIMDSAYMLKDGFEAHGIDGHPLLWVHDELVVEVKDEHVAKAEELMDMAMTAQYLSIWNNQNKIPLKVEGNTSKVWSK